MLTTVGALIIVLGLMVSLARSVRSASAQELTKDLLRKLDSMMDQYEARHHSLPNLPAFIETTETDLSEASLLHKSTQNNHQLLAVLRAEAGLADQSLGGGLPDAIYNDAFLRDAWGTPIIYMPAMHPSIGMAPQNRRFFFSAGPDGQFLTQEDNLYSYEEAPPAARNPKPAP
jgi:type II secretory pathway pseudopilin PulG